MALNEYDDMIMNEKAQEMSVTPIAPANQYDAIVAEETDVKRSNMAQSMIYAAEKEPSRIVKAIQMAKDLGTDVDFVERNMEKIEKSKKTIGVDYDALLKDSPGVAQFMETPENAAVGQDDMDAMKRIDKSVRFMPKREEDSSMKKFGSEMYQAGEGGWNNMTANLAALVVTEGMGGREWIEAQAMMNKRAKMLSDKKPDYVKEFQRVMEEETGDVGKGIEKLKASKDKWTRDEKMKAMKGFVEGGVETVAEFFDVIREAVWGPERVKGLLYSAGESLTASTPAVVLGGAGSFAGPGAIVAMPAGVFAGSAIIEAGSTVNALLEEKGIDITDPDALEEAYKDSQFMTDVRSQARKKGVTTAAMETAISVFGGHFAGKLGKSSKTMVKKVAARAADTGVEMAGESVGQIAGEFAQYDGDFSKVDIAGAIQEGVMSLGTSFIQAGQSAAVKGEFAARRALYDKDPMVAVDQVISDTDKAQTAVQSAQNLQELSRSLKETTNLKNIPDKVAELVEASTGGQGASAVYFQTDDFDGYWSKKGVNPVDKAAEIMGDGGKSYQDSKNTGGVFEVPLDKYAATIGLTEDFDGLLPVTRTSPDAMSLSEAKEHLTALPAMVQQVATEATSAQALVEPVEQAIQTRTAVLKQDIQDKLVAAGRPVREAKYAAQQVEAFFKTTAQKFGMNLEQFEDFVTKYNPTISQMTQPAQMTGEGQTFNQVGTTMQESGPQVSPLGFFSQVEAEVQKMDFKTMPGKDLSGRIKNIAGIKKEELEFLGLNEWLDTQEGKVTKEDVVNFIRNQGLVVDQLVLSKEYLDKMGGETAEIEWGNPKRDRDSDSDSIDSEMEYYLSENEDWYKENAKDIREARLEEFTDEEGIVDEAGLTDAVDSDIRDRAEKAAREVVEDDDYHGARFDVRLEIDGERYWVTGSDEYGWYVNELDKTFEANLEEAKILILAAMKEKGLVNLPESSLNRVEDVSWSKRPTAKMPTRETIKKKVAHLIKHEYDNLLKAAKEDDDSNKYILEDFDKKTKEEQKQISDEIVEWEAKQRVNKSYEDPDNKKNKLSYNLDHPIVSGRIEGNNVNGWTLFIDGDAETTRDGGIIRTGSFEQALAARDVEAAKAEALNFMIENKVVYGKGAVEEGAPARDINEPVDTANFEQHIAPGERSNYREFLLTLPKSEETFVYDAHFSQENVVAHARVTDRVDVNGKKVLFIEEVQSDWHQKGRSFGYKGDDGLTKEQRADKITEIRGRVGAVQSQIEDALDQANQIPDKVMSKAVMDVPTKLTLDSFKKQETKDFRGGAAVVYSGLKDVEYGYGEETVELYVNSDEAVNDGNTKYEVRVYGRVRHQYGGALLEEALESFREEFIDDIDRNGAVKTLEELNDERYQSYKELKAKAEQLGKEEERLNEQFKEVGQAKSVPDAPLKNTEAWAALVMKRMVRLAVEQGYDSVAWSPASFQIERWGTEEVSWIKKPGIETTIKQRPDGLWVVEGDGVPNKGSVFKEKEGAEAYQEKMKEPYFMVGSTEQVGGRYEGGNIEEMARARGELLERKGERVTTKEELRSVIDDTLYRDRSEKQLAALTDNFWELMQTKESGLKAPRKEGMQFFYDNVLPKKVMAPLLKKLDKDAKVTTTKIRTKGELDDIDVNGPVLTDEELKAADEKNLSEVWNVELTPTIKAKTMEGFALFQGDPNTPLGQIRFGESGINIDLLKGANPSTFMHEMGHAYLQIMTDLQGGENVPQNVKDDFAKILEFLEVESADKIGVEQHEKFARGFEAYLREGRAPSEGLRKAFANFKAWLLTVYKNLTELRVELNDDIRGVFDRMLATEEEITQAKNKITGEFDMQKLEVTTEKQMEYMVAVSEWQARAEESLMSKIMGDYERQKQAEYRAKKKEVSEQFERIANEMTVYRAVSLMRDGTRPDGSALPEGIVPFKLERSSLEKMFSKEIIARLPARIISPVKKGGGMNVELAAGQLGFEDADQFIQMLVNTPKKEDYIKMQTEAEMKKQYPEIYDEDHETLQAEAMEYVHDELGSKVKRMQLEMIANKAMPLLKEGIRNVSRRLPSSRQIRAQAEKVIGSMKSKDIRPIVFLRAERKAAKEAGVLLARGDFEGAMKAKERELYNFELYRASIEWNDQYKSALNNFKKIYKSDEKVAKQRDMDLVNAARAILAQYGIGKQNKSPEDYLEKMKTYDPDTFETISQLVEGSLVQASSLDDMTADDFIAVKDAVFAIWDLSKTSMEHIVEGQSLNRQEVVDGLNARIGEIAQTQERIGFDQKATWQQEMRVRFLGVKAALRRVEHWTEGMGGTFKKMIYSPVSDATNIYRKERNKFIKKYRDLTVAYAEQSPDVFDDKIILAPELTRTDADGVQRSYKFTKRELVGAMLHTGNESNKKKLLAGRKWGTINDDGTLNSAQWDKFIERMHTEGVLKKADYDYVQSLWDLMEELKPGAQKAHKQMYGYYFNEVTAQSVTTPFGNYRGGYAPAVADPFISEDGRIRTEKEALEKMNNTFMFPTTGRGFTKKRVENYVTPLSIDISLVGQHIDKVMRFTHIEPSVKSVGRIAMNKDFRHALTAYDPTVGAELIVPWLQRAAQQRVSTPSANRAADWMFTRIRANAGMNAMFLNITNALQQFTGWSISLLKVKPKYLRGALWTYTMNPKKTSAMVAEKSSFMAARMDKEMQQVMRDLDEILTSETVFKKTQETAKKHAYVLQAGFQNVVDVTTWVGAYEQAVENGLNEDQAVREADGAVRTTQGSLNAEDVSRFETGTPFVRVFTMFASYFNNLANTLTTEAYSKNIRDLGLKKGMGRALYVYVFGFAVPAVLSEVIVKAMQGSDFDDDDDDQYMDDFMSIFFGSQFRTATAMVPVAGQIANVAMGQFDDLTYNDRISTSPAISTLESAVAGNAKNLYQAVLTDQDTNKKKVVRDFLSAIGLFTGIPTGQIGKTTGYMIDVAEGKAEPENPIQAVQGAVTGRTPR